MTSYLPLVQSVPIAASVMENVYQETSNTRKSRTPVVNSQVVKDLFTSMNINGNSQTTIDLPQGPLLSHALVALEFSAATLNAIAASTKAAYLSPAWGYDCIDYIQIKTGGNTQLRVYGRQLKIKALEDCETKEKRDALLALGGKEWLGGNVGTKNYIAYVHVYLPWSNISASKYLPYDSGILTKPISLQFQFNSNLKIFSFSQVDASLIIPTLPTQFDQAYFMIQTALMALGPAESIRPAVGPNGEAQYNYGWIYPSPFTSEQFQGVPQSSNTRKLIRLQDFQNGNIQSMTIYLERVSTGGNVISGGPSYPDAPFTSMAHNQTNYAPISNIEIKYGGQTIYRSDDLSNKLMALSEYTCTNDFDTSFPNLNNSTVASSAGFTTNSATASWVLVNFVQFREQYFKNLVQDGPSLVNNMCTIEFNTPELNDTTISNGSGATGSPPTGTQLVQPQYILRANYNMLASVNTWRGYTDMMFLPANAEGPYTMAS
jgi:hypothetical protein